MLKADASPRRMASTSSESERRSLGRKSAAARGNAGLLALSLPRSGLTPRQDGMWPVCELRGTKFTSQCDAPRAHRSRRVARGLRGAACLARVQQRLEPRRVLRDRTAHAIEVCLDRVLGLAERARDASNRLTSQVLQVEDAPLKRRQVVLDHGLAQAQHAAGVDGLVR